MKKSARFGLINVSKPFMSEFLIQNNDSQMIIIETALVFHRMLNLEPEERDIYVTGSIFTNNSKKNDQEVLFESITRKIKFLNYNEESMPVIIGLLSVADCSFILFKLNIVAMGYNIDEFSFIVRYQDKASQKVLLGYSCIFLFFSIIVIIKILSSFVENGFAYNSVASFIVIIITNIHIFGDQIIPIFRNTFIAGSVIYLTFSLLNKIITIYSLQKVSGNQNHNIWSLISVFFLIYNLVIEVIQLVSHQRTMFIHFYDVYPSSTALDIHGSIANYLILLMIITIVPISYFESASSRRFFLIPIFLFFLNSTIVQFMFYFLRGFYQYNNSMISLFVFMSQAVSNIILATSLIQMDP